MVLCRTIIDAILHCISSTKMVLNSTDSGSLARREPLKGLITPQNLWRTIQELNRFCNMVAVLYSPSGMPKNCWGTTKAPRFLVKGDISWKFDSPPPPPRLSAIIGSPVHLPTQKTWKKQPSKLFLVSLFLQACEKTSYPDFAPPMT